MKRTIQIAKLELSTLFYSPIAWLLLIVFFVQCAMSYTDMLKTYVTFQELGGGYLEQMEFLTSKIFGNPYGIAPSLAYNLYLYLPLLTMGLVSREVSSGTIKLLYSSPVKVRDIIMGKFVAIATYGLLLTLLLGVFLITGTFHLENADTGLLMSIMLGVFLLLCAYGAIGLFVSCLTSYQVVAAISTFVVFSALNYLRFMWQDIDFVRDITYALSLAGRISNMTSGLITTKDILYFLTIMYIFLGLSVLKLQAGRSTDSTASKSLKYISLILSGLFIGYISSRPTLIGYLDVTETKTQTLTTATRDILAKMDQGPVEVTSYINLLEENYWNGVPAARNWDLERWLPFIRFKPDIRLNYVYYYDSVFNDYFYKSYPKKSIDDIAANHAKSFGADLDNFKKPEEIRSMINLKPELNRYVMHLTYNGKSTFLRLFDDALIFPTEQETGAAMKRLTTKLPRFAFLEGELERRAGKAGDRDYRRMTSDITFRYAMVNQGFDFTTVSLKDGNIPNDVSALVIADPRIPLDTAVLAKIQKYIGSGGNLLIAGEPGKQSVLNPLLNKLGMRMMDGMIVQKTEDFSPSLTFNYLTPHAASFSASMARVHRDSGKVTMPTVSGIEYDSAAGFLVRPLLMTDERISWNKSRELSSDSVDVNFTAQDGDQKGKFPTMLALTRKVGEKEQRIIVSADADFMSTMELARYNPRTVNFRFNTALFGWLSNGEFPIDVTRPEAKDKVIQLKGSDIGWLKIWFVWIVPFVILLCGTILLTRRKKK